MIDKLILCPCIIPRWDCEPNKKTRLDCKSKRGNHNLMACTRIAA